MKFTTNTKPLVDSLNLGIINSNVSNFHKKSGIVQLTAEGSTLRINIEASMIRTEIELKGSGEGTKSTIFVDSLLFKQLVGTLDTATVTLNIDDDGLKIQSGKSRFTIPKSLDAGDLELAQPAVPADNAVALDIHIDDWKFVKDYQMYAIAMSFVFPVYTRVWVGESGDVLVGNYATSLFTHSKKGNLGTTCLLSDTIINLFTSLPEGAKLIKSGSDYLITFNADGYTYKTQFTPQYESDPEVGPYNAEVFLEMMNSSNPGNTVVTANVTKLLNQALLLSSTVEDTISFSVKDNVLYLKDNNVDSQIALEGSGVPDYRVTFKLETLKKVVANYPDDKISFEPLWGESSVESGVAEGIRIWNKDITTVVAGVTEG